MFAAMFTDGEAIVGNFNVDNECLRRAFCLISIPFFSILLSLAEAQ